MFQALRTAETEANRAVLSAVRFGADSHAEK